MMTIQLFGPLQIQLLMQIMPEMFIQQIQMAMEIQIQFLLNTIVTPLPGMKMMVQQIHHLLEMIQPQVPMVPVMFMLQIWIMMEIQIQFLSLLLTILLPGMKITEQPTQRLLRQILSLIWIMLMEFIFMIQMVTEIKILSPLLLMTIRLPGQRIMEQQIQPLQQQQLQLLLMAQEMYLLQIQIAMVIWILLPHQEKTILFPGTKIMEQQTHHLLHLISLQMQIMRMEFLQQIWMEMEILISSLLLKQTIRSHGTRIMEQQILHLLPQ